MFDPQITIANNVIPYVIFAVGLNLVLGNAGQPTMAQAALGAVGGYIVALLSAHTGVPFLLTLVMAIAAGVLVAVLVALPVNRLNLELFVLVTFGVVAITQSLIGALGPLGGQSGIAGIKQIKVFGFLLSSPTEVFALYLPLGILATLFCWRLGNSSFGVILRAIRDDNDATEAVGRSAAKVKLQVNALSGGLAALAGALIVYNFQVVGPGMFSAQETIYLIAMVVIGGSGNTLGAALGGIFVTALTPFLQSVVHLSPSTASLVQLTTFGAILIVIVMVRPAGLIPERRRRWAHASGGSAGLMSVSVLDDPVGAVSPGIASGDAPPHGTESASDPHASGRRRTAADAAAPALRAVSVSKTFGGIRAVRSATLSLFEGELTVLIGPNGAGKSTLFSLFTGATAPDAGRIELFGRNIVGLKPDRIANLGMVRSFQDVRLFSRLTVVENVMVSGMRRHDEAFFAQFWGGNGARSRKQAIGRSLDALERVGMREVADAPVQGLSYAEKKLIAIARTLATGSRVLLFDEPTSGVDPASVGRIAAVIRAIAESGTCVCVVEHNLDFVRQLEGRCYFMAEGTVKAYGTLEELMGMPAMREAYFGLA